MDLREKVKEAVEILKVIKDTTNDGLSLELGYNKTYISDLIGENARKSITEKFLRTFYNYFIKEVDSAVIENPMFKNRIYWVDDLDQLVRDLSSGLSNKREYKQEIARLSETIGSYNAAELVVSEPDYKHDRRSDNDINFYNDFGDTQTSAVFKMPYFKNCIAVIIDSDCMEPLIKSGSVLFEQKIRDWKEHLEFGRVYDIMTTDKRRYTRYIKKIDDSFLIERKEAFLLKCENGSYEDFELLTNNIKEIRLVRGWLHKSS